jgi:uncharacterized membrane protein YwaF
METNLQNLASLTVLIWETSIWKRFLPKLYILKGLYIFGEYKYITKEPGTTSYMDVRNTYQFSIFLGVKFRILAR